MSKISAHNDRMYTFLAVPCAVAAFLPTVLRVEEPVVLAFFAVE